MKIVREHINEKFIKDSDPIKDMGIGMDALVNKFVRPKFQKTAPAHIYNDPWYKLYLCVDWNKPEFVKFLLSKYKYKKEDVVTFKNLARNKNYKEIYILIDNYLKEDINEKFTGDSDPIKDMGIGMHELIKRWLKSINNEYINDDTALFYCSVNGKIEFVKYLLETGADVHVNNDGALQRASSYGHVEVVKMLLDAGANVHVIDDRALRLASENGHAEVVKVLLNAGANVHANNDEALRFASERGYTEVVKVLLDAGANVHVNNDVALRLASSYGHVEVVEILKNWIAKEKKSKIVKESLNEKFTGDSDPIKDLGIGMLGIYKNLKKGDILQVKKFISTYRDFPQLGDYLLITEVNRFPDSEYCNTRITCDIFTNKDTLLKHLKNHKPSNKKIHSWGLTYKFFAKHFVYLSKNNLKKSVNEKFTGESDPVKDLGIGMIKFWEKERDRIGGTWPKQTYEKYFEPVLKDVHSIESLFANMLYSILVKICNDKKLDLQNAFDVTYENYKQASSGQYLTGFKYHFKEIKEKMAEVLREHFHIDVDPNFNEINN